MTSLRSDVKMGLMKKLSLYIFLFLMWCNVGSAGWFSKELYINCFFTEESGNDFIMIDVEDGNFCVSFEKGADTNCTKVDKFNSKEVKSIVLDPSSSPTANIFGQKVYWKINRKNGVTGIYAISNNKMVSEKFNCQLRAGL
jgi:hypothetical protein